MAGNVHFMGLVRRRGDGWSWEGVAPREYASGALRHTLIGPADGARDVELRYFLIPAGGASALESHDHEHAILILHGRALAPGRQERLGEGWLEGDVSSGPGGVSTSHRRSRRRAARLPLHGAGRPVRDSLVPWDDDESWLVVPW